MHNVFSAACRLFMALFLMAMPLSSRAETPLWLRFCALSPDGQTIAFSYKGDIFTVGINGGNARQLTTNSAYDAYPVWSPDGTNIAFASAREGSLDVYIMPATGGTPTRLTTHSGNEIPLTFSDAQHVLFSANMMPAVLSSQLASSTFPQVYEVSTTGGRPRLYSTITMEQPSINANGDVLYHDVKGYEDPFRKHHVSAITRDIWLLSKGQYTKLTSFRGEDRNPVWAPDGRSFYYLSEKDGTFNVWKRNTDGSGEQQLTHHTKNPVRFLTADKKGTLCYAYDGEIYVMQNGQERKVNINITTDNNDHSVVRRILHSGATEICLSPNNKEIAFILHGDVYVTAIDYSTTRQITDTPEQERDLSFSPDGRSIAYSSERNGVWQIYRTTLAEKSESQFTYSSNLTEERLTDGQHISQQPKYSPDGKQLAFFEDRGDLRVLDIASRSVRTVLDGKYQCSYTDGDLWFEWSPDSRWLLASYIGNGGWHSPDVALVDASGQKPVFNLTNSGYSDDNAQWALGGKAIIYQSDRAGYRSHGSWGAESDEYIMFLDQEAYERFLMSKEEKEIYDKKQAEARKASNSQSKSAKANSKTNKNSKTDKGTQKPAVKPLVFDLDNCQDRIIRLTVNSSHLGDAILSPKGDTLYYQSRFEDGYDLWCHNLLEEKTELVMKNVGYGNMQADASFKHIYLLSRGIKKLDLAKNKKETVEFDAPSNYRGYEERQYLFDHTWRQVKEKFYDPELHGVDWEGYRDIYARFLPHINNNYDFRDMLSEMLGELNGSHTGARYRTTGATLKTASLGVFIDQQYDGDGLRIEEVIKRSPLALHGSEVKAGCIIESIDGHEIKAGADYFWMLDGKAGKSVRLSIYNPRNGQRKTINVKAISQGQLQTLLYKRWVEHNEHLVDSISGGQVAYVHVESMDSENFRKVYSKLLNDKNRNRKAVVVDERHNGGGWLHDDLCTLLSGKLYHNFVPRGKYVGRDPLNKWVAPSCILMDEDCYSNGSGFPWVYRELGIGKLIGTPVAGTATSVWWETQMDPTLVFGIPQIGKKDMRGNYMENQELLPDIEVYNTPEDFINGRDPQLETAVREMMRQAGL